MEGHSEPHCTSIIPRQLSCVLFDLNDFSLKVFSRVCWLRTCVNCQSVTYGSKVIQCTVVWGSDHPKSPCFGNNSGLCDSIFMMLVSAWPLGSTDHVDVLFVIVRPQGQKLFKYFVYDPRRVKGHRDCDVSITSGSRSSVNPSFKFLHSSTIELSSF